VGMNIKIIDVGSTNVANPAALFNASAKSTQANPITKIFMFHPPFFLLRLSPILRFLKQLNLSFAANTNCQLNQQPTHDSSKLYFFLNPPLMYTTGNYYY
jgi:hypothetical protein